MSSPRDNSIRHDTQKKRGRKGKQGGIVGTVRSNPTGHQYDRAAGEMTVLVTRCELFDSGHKGEEYKLPHPVEHPMPLVAPYNYTRDIANTENLSPVIFRVPRREQPQMSPFWMEVQVVDNVTPCPYPNVTKYWNQRRRLFSKFDEGIQLDEEGWFSVTPEQIAHHVAGELRKHYSPRFMLDAFCGCGGNAIAFASVTKVVATDIDRQKLRRAAHNARLYGIPPENLLLVECNSLFVLEYCYRDGQFVLDEPLTSPEQAMALMEAMPPPVDTEVCEGFQIGGIDLLPRCIDAIFMDPPWGGVDYEVFGKHGYDLEHNMKIERPSRSQVTVQDDFFDSFATTRNRNERKKQFNCGVDDSNCVNGVELLQLASKATQNVLYDVPRNTRMQSLGQAALAAGYRGNCKWEEHFLNGRLKTVTAYFGRDWSFLLPSPEEKVGNN